MYGLLGERLDHSHSKLIHEMLADYEYKLLPTSKENLDDFLRSGSFRGINVTIPYKKAVIPFCKSLSDIAKRIGSVNTIVADKNGDLHGDNTDYYGFLYMSKSAGIDFNGKKALVLGSGGTSLMVCFAIRDSGGNPVVISRSGQNSYGNIDKHFDADIIVNTTPVGMYPNNESSPLELRDFTGCTAVLDVVYNPIRTRLLLQAEALGIACCGGMKMLVAQAKQAAEIFGGRKIADTEIERVCSVIEKKTRNIVLIGMPGCGKTAVGKLVASNLNRELVDIDSLAVEEIGTSITNYFNLYGEQKFRNLEAELATIVGKKSGLVISTGGGIVKDKNNYKSLKQNAIIVYIMRDLNKLDMSERPLSSSVFALERLQAERAEQYIRFADIIVDNNYSIESTVNKILEAVR